MTFNLEKSIEILKRTPIVLQEMLAGISNDWIINNEGGETWSPFDILGHLVHGEKTDWIARLKILLSDTNSKTFESFDRFAQFENSKGKSIHNLLEEFATLRAKNLITLKQIQLTEGQLSLKAIHPELGIVTTQQLLACWVTHDLGHIAQIARVMAKQYINEVGPWKAFIPILHK